MAPLKTKGDLAELIVAADLARRGWRIAIPYGEDWDYDLLAWRPGSKLQRVQVKYTRSDGAVVFVRCRSQSLTNGRVKSIKRYTAETVDWIAVYDATSDRCYHVPAHELGTEGRDHISLRLRPARNNQRLGVRIAEDYLGFEAVPTIPSAGP